MFNMKWVRRNTQLNEVAITLELTAREDAPRVSAENLSGSQVSCAA